MTCKYYPTVNVDCGLLILFSCTLWVDINPERIGSRVCAFLPVAEFCIAISGKNVIGTPMRDAVICTLLFIIANRNKQNNHWSVRTDYKCIHLYVSP